MGMDFRETGFQGRKLIRNPAQLRGHAEKRAATAAASKGLVPKLSKVGLGTVLNKAAPLLGRAALPVAAALTTKQAIEAWGKPKKIHVMPNEWDPRVKH